MSSFGIKHISLQHIDIIGLSLDVETLTPSIGK